jgi:hypothetical protein
MRANTPIPLPRQMRSQSVPSLRQCSGMTPDGS